MPIKEINLGKPNPKQVLMFSVSILLKDFQIGRNSLFSGLESIMAIQLRSVLEM